MFFSIRFAVIIDVLVITPRGPLCKNTQKQDIHKCRLTHCARFSKNDSGTGCDGAVGLAVAVAVVLVTN